MVESFIHKHTTFLTLTYSDDYLPLNEFGLPTLYIPHLNTFWKSMRNDGHSIKYYSIGEYGGKFSRPHYHAIVFYDDDIFFNNYWTYGNVHEGTCTAKSIHYVSKFHMYPKSDGLKSDFTQRPFARMSKKLGFDWLLQFAHYDEDDHLVFDKELPDFIRYENYSYPVPRYYRKLAALPPQDFIHMEEKLFQKYGNRQKVAVILSQMLEVSERKLKEYINNSNL